MANTRLYFALHRHKFNGKEMSTRTTLTDDLATWVLSDKSTRKIQSSGIREQLLRLIDKVIKEIRKRLGVKSVLNNVRDNALRCYGHVTRMTPMSLIKRIWTMEKEGYK